MCIKSAPYKQEKKCYSGIKYGAFLCFFANADQSLECDFSIYFFLFDAKLAAYSIQISPK